MNSLKRAAKHWGFRAPLDSETENQYRTALADFVAAGDFIEAGKIRQVKLCAALIRTNKTGFKYCNNFALHGRRYCMKHQPSERSS